MTSMVFTTSFPLNGHNISDVAATSVERHLDVVSAGTLYTRIAQTRSAGAYAETKQSQLFIYY